MLYLYSLCMIDLICCLVNCLSFLLCLFVFWVMSLFVFWVSIPLKKILKSQKIKPRHPAFEYPSLKSHTQKSKNQIPTPSFWVSIPQKSYSKVKKSSPVDVGTQLLSIHPLKVIFNSQKVKSRHRPVVDIGCWDSHPISQHPMSNPDIDQWSWSMSGPSFWVSIP